MDSPKTFDEVRMKLMMTDPPPMFVGNVDMVDRYSREELHHFLERNGLSVSDRILRYYADMGLIARPKIAAKKRGRGKASYFSKIDAFRLLKIKEFQADGLSLQEIKEKFDIENELNFLRAGDREDHRFEYFRKLCNELIQNLPEKISKESLSLYMSTNDQDHLSDLASFLLRAAECKNDHIELLGKLGLKWPEKFFDAIFAEIWTTVLEKTYERMSQERDLTSAVLLSNTIERFIVLYSYTIAVFRAGSAISKAFMLQSSTPEQ